MENSMESSRLLNKFLEKLQIAISRNLNLSSYLDISKLEKILAVDSAYKNSELMVTVGVLWSLKIKDIIEESYVVSKPTYEYIPGLLFIREAPSIIEVVEKISGGWDLLIVDGHGVLHPRRAGLAVIAGFMLDKPTLGIAKKLLVGEEAGGGDMGPVYLDGKVLGFWFKDKRKFYVSPGYKIGVEEIPEIIKLMGGRYPEPLEIADRLARKKVNEINY
ncbi:MAG: endonuclease V [Thaumarchaeota archaeon]|nr:endonuclease V [Candidatus Geocrenenecus arthurdayi]MCL7391489.1 endonuclease V [Candidatus Geocrenenecus arthurdayi]MCL7402849.1 endonuclease V [Candidatus Geocrenenecus arthurdayi]